MIFIPKARMLRASMLICLCVFVVAFDLGAQTNDRSAVGCRASNQLIKKTLDKESTLYWALERNELGNGRFLPWMSDMQTLNIRHASADIYFEFKGQTISLTAGNITFSKQYYYFGEKAAVINPEELAKRQALRDRLGIPFFTKALDLIQALRIKAGSCGHLYLDLLDDACLPTPTTIPYVDPSCTKDKLVTNGVP